MAEEKRDERKRSPGKFEKVDRWVTALTAIPVLGIILKTAFQKLSEKGAEKLTKKLETILGFDTTTASKSVADEIVYAAALYSTEAKLTTEERGKIDDFEVYLRNQNSKKAEAYVLFVAHIVQQLKRETKKSQNPKKGETGPREETSFIDYEKGFALAGEFFKELLKRDKPEEKVLFLQGKNVFSLISLEKKSTLPETLRRIAKSTGDAAIQAGKSIAEDQKDNLAKISAELKKIPTITNNGLREVALPLARRSRKYREKPDWKKWLLN